MKLIEIVGRVICTFAFVLAALPSFGAEYPAVGAAQDAVGSIGGQSMRSFNGQGLPETDVDGTLSATLRQSAKPNSRSNGRATSSVPPSNGIVARRSPKRWAANSRNRHVN